MKELTLLTKNGGAAKFEFLQYYTFAAILYLALTLGLSLIVRYVERRFVQERCAQVKCSGDIIRRHQEEHARAWLTGALRMA